MYAFIIKIDWTWRSLPHLVSFFSWLWWTDY